ncbi:isocitrate lyase/PEP mutase family protein [Moheibacter stercoris]|uniref:2-methylisocitrate lyase-like PEP mutase family enzyme n=1 Tax=Moheibacter stercoris TaxID=1628251 RepID=A0ABV2LVB0_9FLAO
MSYNQFKALHAQDQPLLLGNVWDAHSAKLAEKAGFQALGTSSHAIANAMGYEDGEEISFEELLFVVERIIDCVNIPVSIDFESGYSDDPMDVTSFVMELSKAGAAGINLEDGQVINGKRVLGDAELLAEKIKAIKNECKIFVNARIDTYTTKHEEPLEESIRRAHIYQKAGADGVFVPLIETQLDIELFVQEVKLPLNVFTTPKLPSYEDLGKMGVKRISHGAKQYELLMKKSESIFQEFMKTKDYQKVLGS